MNLPSFDVHAKLNEQTIDEFSDDTRSFLTELKLPGRDINRYCLTVEEILLRSMEKNGRESDVVFQSGKRWFRPFISLQIAGKSANVFTGEAEDHDIFVGGAYSQSILKTIGLTPDYSYDGGLNTYRFRLAKKKMNPLLTILIAFALANIVGLCGMMMPEGIRTGIMDGLLTPIYDTFLNVLGCIAGPMIFLSVTWGIYGMGDASTLKRMGKRMILGFLGSLLLIVVLGSAISLPLFDLKFSISGNGSADLTSIITMILGIVPKNIFSPFVDGNALQIIFLAIIIGLAMLVLGTKTSAVARAVEQINYIVQLLIGIITKLVPHFIFIVVVSMIWSEQISVVFNLWKPFAIYLGLALLIAAVLAGFTAVSYHTNPILLIKKGLPTFIIALTTASSAAAFGSNSHTCIHKYGVDQSVTSFGIPLGIVAFKPNSAVYYMLLSLFFAEYYNMEISMSWILIAVLSVWILAVATPPIPGGSITAYTVLFAQLGIPSAAIAMAIACDAISDFLLTGFDQFALPFALINQAGKLGMLDEEKLRS